MKIARIQRFSVARGALALEPTEPEAKTRPVRFAPLYSGNLVQRGHGNLIVDLNGMKVPDRRTPILMDHSRDSLMGQSINVNKTDESLTVDGVLFRRMPATKLFEEAEDAGFEYDASAGFSVERVEFLEKGAKATINGRVIAGPALVVTESELLDATITPIGADRDARTLGFSGDEGGLIEVESGDETMATKAKDLESTAPQLDEEAVEKLKAEGAKNAEAESSKRLKRLEAAFTDRPGFVLEQFKKGNDVAAAKAELSDVLQAELKAAKEEADKVWLANAELTKRIEDSLPGHVEPKGTASEGDSVDFDAIADPEERAKAMWAVKDHPCHEEYSTVDNLAADLRYQDNTAEWEDRHPVRRKVG